eukprot:TRINITY_DN6394_c0_g1_i4.p1 TRINITY_DN6394_c0_g1~~TRINITY_DN6394_c0_g1_i4.p1  ORF type:complete len:520 (-),score=94.58 TRINITY_DN6394_c0_g1_i4:260-1819(-)
MINMLRFLVVNLILTKVAVGFRNSAEASAATLEISHATAAKKLDPLDANTTDEDDDEDSSSEEACQCMLDLRCSSCDLAQCPFGGDSFEVKAMSGGGTAMVEGVAAWSVTLSSGERYIVKFGGPMTEPVKAAQMAHALGVVTPRQLLVNHSLCPQLWTTEATIRSEDDREKWTKILKKFKEDPDKILSIQDFADEHLVRQFQSRDDEANLRGSFWYQIGSVAALDWLIGKSDLFNDIKLDWDSDVNGRADLEPNLGNLIIAGESSIAIDIMMDMQATRWDLWSSFLEQLQSQHSLEKIEWVEKVVIPVVTLIKSHGRVQAPGHEFLSLKYERYSGWKSDLSPLIIQLGMIDAVLQSLSLPPRLREYAIGLKQVDEVFGSDVRSQLETLQRLYMEDLGARWVEAIKVPRKLCCRVKCSQGRKKATSFWGSIKDKFSGKKRSECDGEPIYQSVQVIEGESRTIHGDPNIRSCSESWKKQWPPLKRAGYALRNCPMTCGKDSVKWSVDGLEEVAESHCPASR